MFVKTNSLQFKLIFDCATAMPTSLRAIYCQNRCATEWHQVAFAKAIVGLFEIRPSGRTRYCAGRDPTRVTYLKLCKSLSPGEQVIMIATHFQSRRLWSW